MGIGERQQETDIMTQEEGCLNPLTKIKDPESSVNNHKQEIWWKNRSARILLIYSTTATLTTFIFLIVVIVLSGREKTVQAEEGIKVLPVQCPGDWILYSGKCYYFSDERDTWSNSQKYCESHNSSLAVIDNVKELNFLNRLKDDENHWIGLSRTKDDSGWVWTNGTSYTENLFRIERLPVQKEDDSERAFLNHDGVKSGSETIKKKWFCKKRLPNHSS